MSLFSLKEAVSKQSNLKLHLKTQHAKRKTKITGKNFEYSKLYSNLLNNGLNVGGVLACMISWTIIYIPLTWYIERIFPGEYGAPLPFYFPFMVKLLHFLVRNTILRIIFDFLSN